MVSPSTIDVTVYKVVSVPKTSLDIDGFNLESETKAANTNSNIATIVLISDRFVEITFTAELPG